MIVRRKNAAEPSPHMRRALRLAARAAGDTSPNPMVGAVLVRNGRVVGEGHHRRAGAAHAEHVAIAQAGARARGATLYVTLEPCAHRGRTPPCTDAIVRAGIARVVIALEDPDARVRGRGIAALKRAGVDVEIGDGGDAARELNRAYLKQRTSGLPYLTLKIAQTLDGYVARRRGERTPITGARSAAFTRRERIEHDVVMIGVDTAIVDDPLLTVRPRHRRAVPYLRVVVDSHGRIPPGARILHDQRAARTLIATTRTMPRAVRARLQRSGARVMVCRHMPDGRVDLHDLLKRLGRQGHLSVLCEAGPTLARALLAARLVDRIHWLIASKRFGRLPDALAAPEIARARIDAVAPIGRDVFVSGTPEVQRSSPGSSHMKARSSPSKRRTARAGSSSKARSSRTAKRRAPAST
ncbi:MAG: bifunctional diaminohydroxyphosphoribosylaminopyrimidine deaminase/5-amino-6-(5-phosphoribosylamino)uracil reductase RibD [Candidatus Eremiobacteraeota bacterium]|nr:bifunctional diaminohydroxyphosphoribosylaminopyrimidine deaminase/5-amino-6-(5-phosphoribosylamino)uracil reductase RibD [Candidatus Eremiobacteraeota bacterium]